MNKSSYTSLPSAPEAHISVKKDRQKTFGLKALTDSANDNKVYLEENTEFEIELFNPTQFPVQAKISLNGTLISQRGLVVKPGQRIFLDRFIDVANKFKFETYEIESFEGVEKAIAKNGLVEISFYNEKQKPNLDWTWRNNTYYTNGLNINNQQIGGLSNISTGGYVKATTTGMVDLNQMYTTSTYSSNSADNFKNLDWMSQEQERGISKKSLLRSMSAPLSKVETGRVEQGSKSDTTFSTVYLDFETFTSKVYKFMLLPVSQKPIEIAEVVKQFCSNCGAKQKKKNNFCPACGTKL